MNILPCCSSDKNLDLQKDENVCSHVITALVVAILLGAAAATTTYFFTEQNLMWTGIAGGGAFVLAGGISYIALQCLYGQPKPETDDKPKPIQETLPQPKPASKLIDGVPAIVLRAQKDGKVDRCMKMNHQLLPSLYGKITDRFSHWVAETGMVFYDPTNELPIPLVRLYQEMLNHPDFYKKRVTLYKLFAEELALISDKIGNNFEAIKAAVASYLASLPPDIVSMGLGEHVHTDSILNRTYLAQILKGYKSEETFQATIRGYDDIIGKLHTDGLDMDAYFFGTALHDGGCFFHTVAQLLNHHLHIEITEQELRSQCYEKMKQDRDGIVSDEIEAMKQSSREIEEENQKNPSQPKKASQCEFENLAAVIADLFNIEIKLYMPKFETQVVTIEEDESTGQVTEVRLTRLCDSNILHMEPDSGIKSSGVIRLAQLEGRYFPIWLRA